MLKEFAAYITYVLTKLDRDSILADAVESFIYDTLTILLPLSVIISAIAIIKSYILSEKAGGTCLIKNSL